MEANALTSYQVLGFIIWENSITIKPCNRSIHNAWYVSWVLFDSTYLLLSGQNQEPD